MLDQKMAQLVSHFHIKDTVPLSCCSVLEYNSESIKLTWQRYFSEFDTEFVFCRLQFQNVHVFMHVVGHHVIILS